MGDSFLFIPLPALATFDPCLDCSVSLLSSIMDESLGTPDYLSVSSSRRIVSRFTVACSDSN